MNQLIELIRTGNLFEAKQLFREQMKDETSILKEEYKKWLAASLADIIQEAGRFKVVRVRIRKGKIERRKKVSTLKGYTFRNGKQIKMSPKERRNRRIAQRRGKVKRRGKLSRALNKRKRSLRRLGNLGVRR